jgi:hypothetical protein
VFFNGSVVPSLEYLVKNRRDSQESRALELDVAHLFQFQAVVVCEEERTQVGYRVLKREPVTLCTSSESRDVCGVEMVVLVSGMCLVGNTGRVYV